MMQSRFEKAVRYLIICQPRVGSTWISDLLRRNGLMCSHPYEKLNHRYGRPFPEMQALAADAWKAAVVTPELSAFKLLTTHMRKPMPTGYMQAFIKVVCPPDVRVVRLVREDTDAQRASWLRAATTQRWASWKPAEPVTPAELQKRQAFYEPRWAEYVIEPDKAFWAAYGAPVHTFCYERVMADPAGQLGELCAALDLPQPAIWNLETDYQIMRNEVPS